MLVALVVAHPSPDGYCRSLAHRAEAGLRSAGHEVEVIDLYAAGFRPAMSAEERRAYDSDDPIIDPMVAEHAAVVQRATALVFVYPTWWSGLPAVLKGWLERVMVPGVGFRFDERSGRVRPGLGQVRHLIGISTYGSSRTYVRLVNDNGRRTLTRALRMSCGLRARPKWMALYGIDGSSDERRQAFAERVEREMAGLR
ncbi:MAG: NAD(P)H-dependent oxidoreductase [Ilumatobacteraceae bacterium]